METFKRVMALLAGICLMLSLGLSVKTAHASEIIPGAQSGLYYKLGGGDNVPLPAFYSTRTIPLSVESQVGLGFNCGAFNPTASLANSLNQIKSSFLAVKQSVLSAATAAVTEFPLYELSRADPNLYNLITDAIAGAQNDLAIATKSCEVMQSQIAAGQNPYAHWAQVSLGDKWRAEIGSAGVSGSGDITQARYEVSQDGGKSGVPWVNTNGLMSSATNGSQAYYAGGVSQPPIHVVHDTALAGFKVVLSGGTQLPNATHKTLFGLLGSPSNQSELERVFPTAKEAADWITNVVGDQTITTYDGGQKSSQPGVGLYSDIQTQTEQIEPKLQALVTGETPLTVENLQTVSSQGMALSPEMIHSIQGQQRIIQSIIVNKLAQNLAAMNVINKARLAIQVLQSGGKIPAIYSNQAAQHNLQNAVHLLQQDVQDILMFVKARETLVSNMLSTIVQAGESQIQQNTAVSVPNPNASVIDHGAIPNKT